MGYVEDPGQSEHTQLSTTPRKQSSSLANSKEKDQVQPECGIHKCKPDSMQGCANLVCFTACYSMAALLTQTLTVYLTSQITSVEKQFGFSSSQVGVIMSGNDIGFLVTVLLISHFAKKAHIPRCLGGSTFLFGISGLICCLAYFVDHTPKYLQKESLEMSANDTPAILQKHDMETLLCNTTADLDQIRKESECTEKFVQIQADQTKIAFVMFMIGMLVQGVAKSPRTSLLTAYVDNNVAEKTKTGIYMGIITSMGIFGPSIAFLVGGIFSKIPVDLKDRGLRPKDPRWIGAWWMGFLLFGLLSVVISIPLFFFPKTLKANSLHNDEEKRLGKNPSIFNRIKELPVSLGRVIKNPVYDFTLLSICVLLFSIAGSITFTPKYVEHQFTLPTWKTNIILGIEKVIGASTGTLLGGVFTSKLKLSRLGCLKLKLLIAFLSACLEVFGFLFGCPRSNISGVIWNNEYDFKQASIEVNHSCQTPCYCPDEFYPVCGSDNVNYLSPCTAGCTTFNQTLEEFASCYCIQNGSTAISGLCETDCPYLYPFIGINLLKSFISTFAIVPGYVILLRSVLEEDKAIAIGMMSFLTSLLGWLPGPIVFGHLLDSTCVWWSELCGIRGECLLYDIKDMRIKIHVLTVSLRFLSGVVLIGAFVAAYIEEKRLEQSGQSLNIFSRKMTFAEAKSPAKLSKVHISSVSSKISVPTNDRNIKQNDAKGCIISYGTTSGGDNVSGTRLNSTSTRL